VAEYLVKLRKQSFIEVKPGYVDSGAVASAIGGEAKQAAQAQLEQGKKGKKK
jgi:hypothetical protein